MSGYLLGQCPEAQHHSTPPHARKPNDDVGLVLCRQEASVCLIASELLNIDNIDEIADALPADEVDRYTFLASLSKKVVKLAWP